jgi:hypothetical protein
MLVCLGGLTAIAAQVRCIDAAREAARLSARGDDKSAEAAVRAVAPAGAVLHTRRDGGFVVATVTATSTLLPGVTVGAKAVAAVEPAL